MATSINNPKQIETGICNRNIRKSSFKSLRRIRGNSRKTNKMFTMIVHCPIVKDVNMLNT